MPLLNDPTPDPDAQQTGEWSESDGLRAAVRRGLVWAAFLAIPTGILAGAAPFFAIGCFVRGAVAFAVGWILFSVVHRAAGFAGVRCTLLACGLALVVMLSNHIVFAVVGTPAMQHAPDGGDYEMVLAFPGQFVLRAPGVLTTEAPRLSGLYWFSAYVVALTNLASFAGIGIVAALRHSGRMDFDSFADILGQR